MAEILQYQVGLFESFKETIRLSLADNMDDFDTDFYPVADQISRDILDNWRVSEREDSE